MSLLQKASIITTPTAYAEDYLYSIKPAYTLGSSLTSSPVNLSNDFNPNGSSSITDADTFTSTGGSLDGIASKTSVYTLTVGRRFQIEIQGNTTSSGLTLGAGNGNGDEYGSGFGVHTFVSLHAQLWIRQRTSGTTNITRLTIQEVTDADFDFDRNSTGTRVNEDYLIEDVPYNLVLQSNQFDTSWTLFQGGTVTGGQPDKDYGNNAWKLNAVSTQAFSGLYQAKTFTGVTTASIFAKAGTLSHLGIVNLGGSGFAVWFNLSNGTIGTKDASVSNANMQNLGDGWYRCSFTQDVSAAGFFQFKPSDGELTPSTTSGFIYIQDAQLVKGDQPKDYLKTTDRLDIPRIDYTNGEPSILLEPQRTNLIGNNSTAPPVGSATITNNYAISPEGIQNSIRVVTTGSGNNSGVIYSVNNSSTTDTITYSAYVKGEKGKTIHIRFETTPYSLQAQELLLLDGTWQKYTKTINYTGAPTHTLKQFYLTSILSATATDFQVYGAQAEVGSYATSLIHTSGSTVTRSADAANNAGNSDLFNDNEGVLYCEIKATANDGTFREITINDGTQNDVVELRYNNVDNQIQFVVRDGSSVTVNSQVAFSNVLEYNKMAFQYKANDFKVFANGRLVATDTAGTVPSGLNQLDFSWAGSSNFYGNAKSVMVFKEALTDLELEKLTGYNNHELYMNYYNRLSYLGLAEEYNVESDINNYIL